MAAAIGVVALVGLLLLWSWSGSSGTSSSAGADAPPVPAGKPGVRTTEAPRAPRGDRIATPGLPEGEPEGAAGHEEAPAAGRQEPEGGVAATQDRPVADLLREAIVGNSGRVKFCYEKALRRDPELSGRVTLDMVAEGGTIIDVAWSEDDTYDDVFVTCIEDKLIGIEVGGDFEGDITWPFVFRTKDTP